MRISFVTGNRAKTMSSKQILEYVKRYARENGYKTLYLTCLNTVTEAHKLYESVDMKKNSKYKVWYKYLINYFKIIKIKKKICYNKYILLIW